MGKQAREKWERRELAAGENIGSEASERYESKTGLEKACIFIIRWGTYAALFVPLVLLLQFFFPFVAPKTIIFRILAEVIFTAYLFLVFSNRKYRPKIDALTMSITAFLAVFIFASFTGVDFSRSFWSTYERMTGIFTMLHLYAFFIVLKSIFKKREDWEKILSASIISGIFLSVYILKGSEISTRGGGTIGNSSFLAAYLLFDVFFALILFFSNFLKKGGWPLFWQFFSGASLLIMLPVFLASTARGAIMSFFIGLSLLFLGYLIFSGKKNLRRIALVLILLSVILAVSLLIIQPPPVKQKINTTFSEMGSRFIVWENGLKGFLERPILGWGPENFNVVFLKYFNSCMSLPECGSEVWFDRVHNIVFDTLVTTGIVGLISYLSIFLAAIYGLLSAIPKIAERRNVFLPLGLIVLLIAYFLQNLLVFDMINSYLMFFLTLAFAGFLVGKKEEESMESKTKPLNSFLALIIVILMIIVLWAGNVKPLMANYYIIKTVTSGRVNEIISFFQKSIDSPMEKYEAREQYAQKLTKSRSQLIDLSAGEKQKFLSAYEAGEVEMEKSIRENYLDFRHRLFLSELYLTSYKIFGDPEKIEKAEETIKKAIELSPTNQQGYWQLVEIQLAKGKTEEAVPLLKKAVELEPRVGRAHWYLAMGYKIAGDYQLAIEEVIKARKNGYDWYENQEQVNQVIAIFNVLNKDPTKLLSKYEEEYLEVFLKAVNIDPNNYEAWFSTATIYANLGQYDKAREAVQNVVRIKPDLAPKVEEFLKSLPQ